MGINENDKIKIRTATKCYLKIRKKGTAKEIWSFIEELDLKLRSPITPGILARELIYCSKTKNFLNINFEKRKRDNMSIYYLEE